MIRNSSRCTLACLDITSRTLRGMLTGCMFPRLILTILRLEINSPAAALGRYYSFREPWSNAQV